MSTKCKFIIYKCSLKKNIQIAVILFVSKLFNICVKFISTNVLNKTVIKLESMEIE